MQMIQRHLFRKINWKCLFIWYIFHEEQIFSYKNVMCQIRNTNMFSPFIVIGRFLSVFIRNIPVILVNFFVVILIQKCIKIRLILKSVLVCWCFLVIIIVISVLRSKYLLFQRFQLQSDGGTLCFLHFCTQI